jgi:hypothetical protein
VVSKLKGKTSAGFDEIPEFLIKECIQSKKTPLNFIFNEYINQGSFPNLMRTAKVRPVYKKLVITDPYPFYRYFQNF